MSKEEKSKPFDLEDRTFSFAKRTRAFIKTLKMTIANVEDARQLVRSSGSVGGNYIEANEASVKRTSSFESKFAAKKQRKVVTG